MDKLKSNQNAADSNEDTASRWFPYINEADDFSSSVVDTSEWLDKPAGKHGWLKMDGERLVFENGTPVVFWATNITESNVFNAGAAEYNARRLAKYGLNAVRFHKFTWPHSGVVRSEGRSTELDPIKMDGMDKFFSELKKRGIYVTWSHIFGHKISEADALASGFVGQQMFSEKENSYALVNFAEDMQELLIKLTVNLLEHKNPYTGLRYADDPALAIIELQNEDNIFFCMQQRADAFPFYRKLLNAMFCDWLGKKYGSEDALIKAWGHNAFESGESLKEKNIYAYSSPWMLSPESMAENQYRQQRFLDCACFMHETQNQYYLKYINAIRAAGYKGCIIGSPWMANKGIPHYYTLYSDYLAGVVDRHDYWGGGETHILKPGKFNSRAMVDEPGIGLAKRGLERVAGRPFTMSEWMTTPPSEWLTEAPFIIAAYGLGLQGWAGSFSYAIDHTHNVYNVNVPHHIGQYPALARMIYRGDVREGEYVAVQKVDIDRFQTSPDVPQSIPHQLFAAGKTAVQFEGETPEIIDPSPLWNKQEKVIKSSTGQLVWDYSHGGLITLETAGTEGLVGFTHGERVELDNLVVKSTSTPFVNILLSSLGKGSIGEEASLLLTALARGKNTGMKYSEDGKELLEVGTDPLLLEPVQADILLKNVKKAVINVLDQKGARTGGTVPVNVTPDGIELRIDGNYKAIWYEIKIEER